MVWVAALLLAPQVSSPTLKQMGVRLDPYNAFFDYVLAGDELQAGRFPDYERALLGNIDQLLKDTDLDSASWRVFESLKGKTKLEIRREVATKFSAVSARLEAARSKKVSDPRTGMKIDFNTLFPELSTFRTTTRFAVQMAELNYAEGKPLAACEFLLDGFRISAAVRTSPYLIHALVGRANSAITLATIEKYLGQMSYREAQVIRRYAESELKQPTPLRRAIEAERQFARNSVDDFVEGKVETEDAAELAKIAALSPAAKRDLRERVLRSIDREYGRVIGILGQTEAEWAAYLNRTAEEPEPEPAPEGSRSLEQTLQDNVLGVVESAIRIALLERLQMRLLRAAMGIIEFRWTHDQFPAKLADLGQPEWILDPVAGTTMKYRLVGNTFELSVMGSKEQGEIRLRYRRPEAATAAPPP